MPTGPSTPRFEPQKKTIPPKPRALALEEERQIIRQQSQKRKGYASTVLTEGMSLGEADIRKGKVTRLGRTA
jgi:hypothetical protein